MLKVCDVKSESRQQGEKERMERVMSGWVSV